MSSAIPLLEIAPFAFFAALAFTPLAQLLARATGYVDHPEPRKAHVHATPLLGGIAIAAALVAASAIAYVRGSPIDAPRPGFIAGAIVCLVLGLVDDRHPLGPRGKLFGQFLAGACLLWWGSDVPLLRENPFLAAIALLALTTLLNAVNFLDNMDGILGTLIPTIALGFAALALVHGAPVRLTLAWSVIGACAGFLLYNAPPARIFLGDAGSHLLGFTLGALALQALEGSLTWPHVAAILALLAYPIFDFTFVVLDRMLGGRPVYVGSVDHTTHRLRVLAGIWGAIGFVTAASGVSVMAGVWLWDRDDPLSIVGVLGILALGYALFGAFLRHISPTARFVT